MPRSMIPKIRGVGEGYSRGRRPGPIRGRSCKRPQDLFRGRNPLTRRLALAQANSRFLHSAVAAAPAPVGMTSLGETAENSCASPNKETLPLQTGGLVSAEAAGLGADDVARLEAFGAFEQIKLHGLTLVQRAVAVLLN